MKTDRDYSAEFNKPLRLVLFSGLAADANIFVPQKVAFPELEVPNWPRPLPNETLAEYSERLSQQWPGSDDLIIGGASFGGIIALHVAQHLRAKAIVLIGSIKSPEELPAYAKWARWLRPAIRLLPMRLMQLCARPFTIKLMKRLSPGFYGLASQFVRSDPHVIKWSLEQILQWNQPAKFDVPVRHIHGDCDWMLPIKYTKPDCVVKGGGHLISLTHANQVNEVIRQAIQ